MSSEEEVLHGFSPYIAVNSKTIPVFSTKGTPSASFRKERRAAILDVAQWSACQALQR
jgi:hypothetical protein